MISTRREGAAIGGHDEETREKALADSASVSAAVPHLV